MTVFHKAWDFLKASRQTELGEFHPDFPSSYGPMTLISRQPTQKTIDRREKTWRNFDKKYTQPYESFIHQGMTGKPPSPSALDWEEGLREKQPHIKPFTFKEGDTGNWFWPAIQRSPSFLRDEQKIMEAMGIRPSLISYAWERPSQGRIVGVRMPLDESMGMFRDKGYEDESAEAFIYGDIPPERLVMVPGIGGRTTDIWPNGLGRFDQ